MKRIEPTAQAGLFALDFVIALFALMLGMPALIALVVLGDGLARLVNACLPFRAPDTRAKQGTRDE
ncbi:hypothetical protein DFR29_104285 [Tahibacter aquaticus]|uniref:Uncharacterized protein n=1 Tax=Tahibacter aquaticus TaxID=520092 RepID=A0A4R6Z2M2_9GAMM|nr:hypothetical protein [Tahibacter aquaticus]TDR45855.1 hypothetical protein DFR29_104285 [Tahibacter aquaticus]